MPGDTSRVRIDSQHRIRASSETSDEKTIITALGDLDPERFWEQAVAAAAWRASLDIEEQQRLVAAEAEVDHAFEGFS